MSVAKYKAIGRRKDSVARVNMVPGKGDIIINGCLLYTSPSPRD